MDVNTTDPYERKLYNMFKSFDAQSVGTLDKNALLELCTTLELKDRSAKLVANLIDPKRNNRVSFNEFKEGLLNLLGTDTEDNDEQSEHVVDGASLEKVPSPNGDDVSTMYDEAKSREVSPKLVVRGKKYGRRSRPQSVAPFESSQSDSEEDYDFARVPTAGDKSTKNYHKVQRSVSQGDMHDNGRRNVRSIVSSANNNGTKLKRCASLPAQKRNVPYISRKDTENLKLQLESSVESLDEPHDWSNEALPTDQLIDMWEMAHVKNPSALMEDLGFTEREINLSRLLSVIDEELRNVHNDREFTPLLRASLALHKLEVNALQKSLRHAAYENKQLHINVRELNNRSFILAQEVDERHANLESSTRDQIKQLEQRHTEIVRELTQQLSNEREQWSTLNTKLEKRIKQFEMDDAKHKANMLRLQSENSALEKEQLSLQSQIADLLEKNIQLNNEIADAQDRYGGDDDGDRDIMATDQTLDLIDKIAKLQIENANLRDRNDELGIELEETLAELNKVKSRKQLRVDSSNHSGGEDNASSSGEGSNVSGGSATKRRGDSPSKAKLSEESPRFGKLRKYHNDNSEGESETSGDWLALNSELNQSASMSQTTATTSGFSQDFSSLTDPKESEIKELRQQIVKLETELSAMKSQQQKQHHSTANVTEKTGDDTTATLKIDGTKDKAHVQRIQELENSLEQMQKEYEACEDYWQGKLNEERQLYEEEQRISDEKFTELLKKMTEYEEQFTTSASDKDGRLTPIEEKCQLEQQYADLEAETEEFREHARKIFEAKTHEIDQLQAKIKELEERLCYPNAGQHDQHTNSQQRIKTSDSESVASSPISYLWNQSTIQVPTRDYQNPNWNRTNSNKTNDDTVATVAPIDDDTVQNTIISPICRPHTPSAATTTLKNTVVENNENAIDNTTEILDDVLSLRSFGTHSVASTHSIHRSLPEIISTSPNMIREDIKRLKLIEIQLNDEVKGLAHQRDGLVMELQQLQEAKPMLAAAYARTPHPSLIQRIQQLEQKNRHLQFCLKQQQQYTESIMQQSWQQQRTEINELRGTVETQVIIINEQAQRLTNSDLLVKDLYVENSQLTAAIQRLEQQRSRNNMMLQHQGVPGML
ncbi:blastoderm-specific protein 25D isoform X2 [Contarinia nasturtii]|uniref:blastoderm-specific protein 25D isoform X2 n=1 Tax=Contarinia nasturtii TaxID=265458 RepID=UPI0012D3802A|nr:blastoderm-specific protein 25D isoform X2 [Contarinia nasturtii]